MSETMHYSLRSTIRVTLDSLEMVESAVSSLSRRKNFNAKEYRAKIDTVKGELLELLEMSDAYIALREAE